MRTAAQETTPQLVLRKIRYQFKEFSILRRKRCKPLGSLNSFLSYASLGSNPVSQFTIRSGRCLLLNFPQLLRNHLGGMGSICWITVLGALIYIWRPEIADGCDLSCLWQEIRQEIFSFHSLNICFIELKQLTVIFLETTLCTDIFLIS